MGFMMNGMWGGGYGYPFYGWGMMLSWFVIFIIIGYFVYKDANSRGMNGLLWFILVIIPMIGIISLIIYLIIRESGSQTTVPGEKTAMDHLKERYARGEITREEFLKIGEDLKK